MPVVTRLAMLPWRGVPFPYVLDNFGHLLVADTLCSGRLANPVHPLREHFETFFILDHPSYTSLYPPGLGMILALGQVLGHPFVGILLAGALAGLAFYWALRVLMPNGWALVGSLIGSLRFGALSYWMDGYIGGVPDAASGALFGGAMFRWAQAPRRHLAVLGAAGWAMWWFIRPAESCFGLVVTVALVAWYRIRRRGDRPLGVIRALFLPAAPVLLAAGLFTAAYNYAVSGNLLTLPQMQGQKMLGVPQGFIFQPPIPRPETDSRVHQSMYEGQLAARIDFGTGHGFAAWTAAKVKLTFLYFFGFTLVGLLGYTMYRHGLTRVTSGALGMFSILSLMEFTFPFWFPNYMGGSLLLVLVVMTEAVRTVRRDVERHYGRIIAAVAGLVVAALLAMPASIDVTYTRRIPDRATRFYELRARYQESLELEKGRHIVLMDDSPVLERHVTWIHNSADIDNSKIVWARSISPEKDRRLLEYYRDRTVWHVSFEDGEPTLVRGEPELIREAAPY